MLLPKIVTQKLVKDAPKLLSFAHKVVPEKIESLVLMHHIKQLSRPFMEEGELDFIDNKIVLIELNDLPAQWYFTKIENKIQMIKADKVPPQADVTFSASVKSLVLMASQKVDPDTLFFNRELMITGDTELGLEIKNLLDQFDLQLLDRPFQKLLNLWSDQLLIR